MALQNPSCSLGTRKGRALGAQPCTQGQEWGTHPVTHSLHHQQHSPQAPTSAPSSALSPSEEKTKLFTISPSSSSSSFLPHKELARSASFFLNCFLFLMLKASARQLSSMLRCQLFFITPVPVAAPRGGNSPQGTTGPCVWKLRLGGTGQLCSGQVKPGAALPICSTNSPTGKANLPLGFVCLSQGLLALSWSFAALLAWLPKGAGVSPFGSEHEKSTLRFAPSTSHGVWPVPLSHSSAGCTNQGTKQLQGSGKQQQQDSLSPAEVTSALLLRVIQLQMKH